MKRNFIKRSFGLFIEGKQLESAKTFIFVAHTVMDISCLVFLIPANRFLDPTATVKRYEFSFWKDPYKHPASRDGVVGFNGTGWPMSSAVRAHNISSNEIPRQPSWKAERYSVTKPNGVICKRCDTDDLSNGGYAI